MAVQQNKVSKARKRKRRAHDSISAPQQTRCTRCNARNLPHRICGTCGFYRGKALLQIEEF
ncbi:MAG: 50S ribosomal protein L32 [Planctomycetota bacterium]